MTAVLSLLTVFVPIVNLVSFYRTGERNVRMEENAGIQKTVEPILGTVAGLVYFLHVVYHQGHLNKIWEKYQSSAAPGAVAPTPPPVPPPPA